MKQNKISVFLFLAFFLCITDFVKAQVYVEDTTISTGVYRFSYLDTIISPSTISKPVTISSTAKVNYASNKLIRLKNGFKANSFTGTGYFSASFAFELYLNVTKDCNSTDGTIHTCIYGGEPTYTYLWSTSETTSSITYTNTGTYSVTVTDGRGMTTTSTITILTPFYSSIYWTESTGVEVSNDTIKKIFDTGWGNSGAVSRNKIESGENGFTEYRVTVDEYNDNLTFRRFWGLSDLNSNTNYNTIDFAFYFEEDSVEIRENGVSKCAQFKYFQSDIFRIERSGDTIKYIVNSAVYQTSIDTSNSEMELMVDVSLFNENAYFSGIRTSGCPTGLEINFTISAYQKDSLRKLTALVSNGMPPFTYTWNTSETNQSIDAYTTGYTVSVSDNWGSSATASYFVTEPVLWTVLDSTVQNHDTLFSTAIDTNWVSGALSRNIIPYDGSGFIKYIVTDSSFADNSNKQRIFGLSSMDYNEPGKDNIDFAFFLDKDSLRVFEYGIIGTYGTYAPGDTLIISLTQDPDYIANYIRNSDTIYQEGVAASTYWADASFAGQGSYLDNVEISVSAPMSVNVVKSQEQDDSLMVSFESVGGIPPCSNYWDNNQVEITQFQTQKGYYPLGISDALENYSNFLVPIDSKKDKYWISNNGLDVSNDTISKSSSYNGYECIMSDNILKPNEDGFIEYSISYEEYKTNSAERAFGFSDGTSCTYNVPTIKYGYYFKDDSVSRYEWSYGVPGGWKDRSVGGFFKFKPNDILQVLRQGDSIFYLRNNEIINRQPTDNSSELRLEAEIKTQYGWLAPIMASFRAPLKVNYDIVKECGSGTGAISLNIERGSPPYTYSWNTSDTTDTINFTEPGKYTVTVTDNIGVVKVKSIDILFNDMANIEWIDQDSVIVTTDTIKSIAKLSDNSGAASKNILSSNSNGLIDYRIIESDYNENFYMNRYLGFSDRNTDNLTTSIDYGYWFNQDTLRVVENDSVFDISVVYNIEDHCQIIRTNDSIIYKINSDTLRITTTDPAKELMVDAAFGDSASYFKGIKATFCPLPLQVFNFDITNECLADSGSIKVIPTGGTPPYTYLWSTSATTQSIYFNSSWHYIVTITDSQSATVIDTVNTSITQTLANVSWTSLYNTEVISDTLRKLLSATDTLWNANAVSENILKAGEDGFVQFNITKDSYYDNSEKQMYIGLNDRNIDSSYVGMDYAWYFNGSEVRIIEEGLIRMYDLRYKPGDKFIIERDSSRINYVINDSTYYSITTDPSRELFVDASFYNREAYLAGVKTSFCKPVLGIFMADIKKDCDSSSAIISIIPEGGQSPYSYAWSTSATTSSVTVSSTGNYYVTVTDDSSNTVIDTIYVDLDNTRSLVKWHFIDSVSINTDTVTCISGYSYNAGTAYSSNKLEAGEDGYVEWYETKSSYIDNQDKFRSIGFADFNDKNNKYNILYGAYFIGYKANVLANSEVVIDSGSYKPGDLLRIERYGDSIYYKVNDDTVWTVKTDPSIELTLFTSLLDSGAYFHNIKANFCAKPLEILGFEKSKACNSSTAYLQVLVSGGKEPYEYLWSTSDTTEVADYTTNGTYSVTITDAESNTSVSSKIVTTDILAHVNWINIDSCIVDSAALRSNQYAQGWTASAYALNTLTSGNDGEMQYYISKEKYSNNCNKQFRLGLTDGEPTSSSILDYAWYFSSDTLSVYENDTLRIDSIDYNAGDLLTIKRTGDTIKYLINDTIYRTKYSTTISDQNLKVYAKIYDPGTSLNGVKTTFCPENIQVAWYEATRSCDEDSGRIDINVIGGVPPYEYNWSNNDSTATTYYNTTGNYTVTVTDSWGDTSTLTANISTTNNALPEWYSYSGYSISTDSIIKTTDGSNWNYAAITRNRIDKGDNGNISFLETKGDFADNKTLFRRIGLADIMDDSTNFSYGWLLDEDSLKIIENTTIYNIGLYGDTDRLTVKRDGDTIRYVKNTTTVRSVFTDTNRILVGKISSYNQNGYFSHVRTSVCPAPEILVNHTLTKVSPDSLGDVTTQITQGVAPYTYHWSTGVTTAGINDIACGLYKITVTDSVGYHTVSNIYVSDKVSWTSLVGTQASSDTIERTDTINGWQCGAATANTLRSGLDGAIIYKVSDTLDYDKIKVLGLANSSPNTAYDLINYAFYFREDTVEIYESGEMKIELGKYTTNDEFVIARQGDSIRYFKNNVLLRERSTNSNNELHGYASLYSSEASFKGIRATFLPASSMLLSYHVDSVINGENYLLKLDISGGATPYVYEWSNGHTSDTLTTTATGYRVSVTDKLGFMSEKPVILTPVSWINTDSTSVSDNRLYADHSQTLWHAGAFSGNTLEAGSDGFVFYQSTDTTNKSKIRILGFSNVEQNVSDTTVNYGFLFDEDTLKITESGTIIDTIGKYNTTDRFHIFRSGLDIKYMYNDAIVREMTDSSLAEKSLLVDVSFKSPDASFENVMTSFSYPASLNIAHTITPIDDRNDIDLTVTGGLSPYTYMWNNGKDTSSVTNLVTGEYIVTVTDFVGTSQTKTIYLFEDVSWNHRDSTIISGDTLLKSVQYGTEMNSWGTSSNILNSYRNGTVEYTVSNTGYTENNNKERAFGLSNSTDNLSSGIDYAFVLNKDELQISESGAIKYDNLEYAIGDNLQVIRTGNYVKYYKNDTLLREISVANSYALVAKAGFSNNDAYFDHIKVSFVAPMLVSYRVSGFRQDSIFNTEITATNEYSPYSYSWANGSITDTSNILPGRYAVTVTDSLTNSFAFNVNLPNVIWTSLDSAIVGGDTLYEYAISKNSGIGIGSAFSTNIIRSNTDGFLSYGESTNSYNQNVNIRRAIGLSETNGIDRYNSIMYGYNFYKDSVYVIESGVSRTLNVKYNAGDVFNIERKDTLLTYYINDTSVRQIVVDKSKVLYADVAIGPNGYIESVVMSQYPDMIFTASIINRYNETKGTVNLAVSGGLAPYTMNWSNGSIQDTISNLTAGIYRVTVTDAAENTKTNTYPIVRNTLWKNMVGLSFNSDTLRKTTGTSGWTAGALARNFLPAYNQGYVIYKDNTTSFNANNSKKRMFGLSTENSVADSSTIKFAFMLDGTSLKIYENGSYIQSCGTYSANKSNYILRSNDTVYYYKNGVLQKTTIVDPSEILYPDVSIYTPQAYFLNIQASFELPEIALDYTVQNKTAVTLGEITVIPSQGTPPYTYDWSTNETAATIDSLYPGGYNVTVTDSTGLTKSATVFVMGNMIWNNHNHTVLSNDTVYKVNNTYSWDADAVSANILQANVDGAIEFAVTNTTDTLNRRCVGLTTNNINSNPYTIDYRFFIDGKQISAFNKGEKLGTFGNFAAGDTFRIARTGSQIKYYRDKETLATITIDPAEELMTDVAFYEDSAYFDHVLASFSDSTFDLVPYKPIYAGTTVNIYPDKDATVMEAYPATNYGNNDYFQASKGSSSGTKGRSLMDFDVNWIPENAVITNATLYLQTNAGKGHSAVDNHSALVMNDTLWYEDSVTWNNKPDLDTTGIGYIDIPASDSSFQNYSIDIKKFVNAWHDGTKDNYGFTFRLLNESSESEMVFESTEASDSLRHPRVEISYYVPVKLVATMYPNVDATIYNIDSTTTNATNNTFMASSDTTGNDAIRRSLMKFDLSVIPPNAIIDSARLYLYGTDHSGNNAACLKRVTTNWYEDSVTWKTQPTADIRQQLSTSQTGSATEDDTINVKELVQNWVDGTYPNYGMLLKLQNENIIARLKYGSSDNTDTTIVPKLEVFYTIQPLEVPYVIETDTVDSTNTVRLAAYGGTPPYTYRWSDGSTTGTIENMDYGSHAVTVTDAWGSWAMRTIVIDGTPAALTTYNCDVIDRNYTEVKSYKWDETLQANVLSGEGRQYYNKLGKTTQTISKIMEESDKYMVAQTLYDVYGRPVLSTLPAPVEQSGLCYRNGFITNTNGNTYSISDFDDQNQFETGTLYLDEDEYSPTYGQWLLDPFSPQPGSPNLGYVYNPAPVSENCPLGWYYSNYNTWESYVPSAQGYPYSRVEYSKVQPGTVRKSTLAGNTFKMGSGHESKSISMPANPDELLWHNTLLINDRNGVNKSISIDNNGNELVTYSTSDGRAISQCLPGYASSNTIYRHKLFNNTTWSDLVDGKHYYYVHIPKGTESSFKLIYKDDPLQIDPLSLVSYADLTWKFKIVDLSNDQYVLNSNGTNLFVNGMQPIMVPGFYKIEMQFWINSATTRDAWRNGNSLTSFNFIFSFVEYALNYGSFSASNYDITGRLINQWTPLNDKSAILTSSQKNNYNSLNQLLYNVSEDEGTTEYQYRKDGKLRFYRNQAQQSLNTFSYINYDVSGRVIETGEYRNSGSCTSIGWLSSAMNSIVESLDGLSDGCCFFVSKMVNDLPDPNFETESGLSLANFPQLFTLGKVTKTSITNDDNQTDHAKTWYGYDDNGNVIWLARYLNGLGTKTIEYEYDFQGNLTKVIYQRFDNKERLDHIYNYNNNGQLASVSTIKYDNSGNPLAAQEHAEYKYYLHGPLERTLLGNNLQGEDYVYTLNGWLKGINDPSLNQVVNGESIDPGKDGFSGANSSVQKDLFGEQLDYFTGDYSRVKILPSGITKGTYVQDGDPNINNAITGLSNNYYNGSIKSSRWKIANQNFSHQQPITTSSQWMYSYHYDDRNWLKQSDFGTYVPNFSVNGIYAHSVTNDINEVSTNRLSASGISNGNYFNVNPNVSIEEGAQNITAKTTTSVSFMEGINSTYFNVNSIMLPAVPPPAPIHPTRKFFIDPLERYREYDIFYDNNGNISNLKRNAYEISSGIVRMDELEYHYIYNNRLNEIHDHLGSTSFSGDMRQSDFDYDVIGRTTKENAYTTLSYYNQLNKIKRYSYYAGLVLDYNYDDLGNCFDKYDVTANTHQYSVRDLVGNIIASYEKIGTQSPNLLSLPIYGGSRLGMVNLKTDNSGDVDYYGYELNDHLGNVRVTFREATGGGVEQLTQTDYYPFGMEMPDRHWVSGSISGSYKFGYQGQFAENETQRNYLNEFQLRQYDSRIGRWLTTDPYDQFSSPYLGMGNNPVNGIDANGGFSSPIFDIATGKFMGVDSEGYKGEILFMKNEDYKRLTSNGKIIDHNWAVNKLSHVSDLVYSQKGLKVISTAFTHVLSQKKDLDISNLRNGTISAVSYDWQNIRGYFFNCSKADGIWYQATAFGDRINGKSFVAASFILSEGLDLWSTVENVQNGLGVHELKGHAILNLSGSDKDHAKIFKMQFNDPTWKNTTPSYKEVMNSLYKGL